MSTLQNKFIYLFFIFFIIPVDLLAAKNFDHSHSVWGEVLQEHVNSKEKKGRGTVSTINYAAINKNPKKLKAYLKQVEKLNKDQFKSWSHKQQLAFLANAYNALTVKIIIDNSPLKSIKDIGGLFSSAWKKKFFTFFNKSSHLDYLEHSLARNQDSKDDINLKLEPRLHFMFNCASIGCPALLKEPFQASKLEEQMEKATKGFLLDTSRNRYDAKKKTLYLSKIFYWYGDDFKPSVKNFVSQRMGKTKKEKLAMRSKKTKIEFLDYNWELNKHK